MRRHVLGKGMPGPPIFVESGDLQSRRQLATDLVEAQGGHLTLHHNESGRLMLVSLTAITIRRVDVERTPVGPARH